MSPQLSGALCDGPLRDNPYRVGKALRAPLAGRYSAHRGAYRVRYRVDDDKHLVTVIDIACRAEAYRPGRARTELDQVLVALPRPVITARLSRG